MHDSLDQLGLLSISIGPVLPDVYQIKVFYMHVILTPACQTKCSFGTGDFLSSQNIRFIFKAKDVTLFS